MDKATKRLSEHDTDPALVLGVYGVGDKYVYGVGCPKATVLS